MSDIDQQFIEFVVKSLVGKPDAVHVDRRVDEKGVLLELTVDPEDLGRVIGKRGATAQSLRTLLRALGTKNDARYNLKIIDNGVGGHGYGSDDHATQPSQQPAPQLDDMTAPMSTDEPQVSEPVVDDQPIADSVVEEEAAPEKIAEVETSDSSDRLAQTRKELADLDDLDV
jgi:predicted RNA-binding protein YlqC (UPF0109 family)